MPLKIEPEKKKLPIRKIIGLISLLIMATAVILALRKPIPVAAPRSHAAQIASAQSFQAKVDQLAEPTPQGQSGSEPAVTAPPASEVHLTADEVRAAFSDASPDQIAAATAAAGISEKDVALGEPIVSFEGDQMKGQFVSEIAGKKVYVTVNGHLGAKDGYATFQPTEFKIGDLNVPVSLVNDALQKKLGEQRDRLKLPDYISDLKIENGELVVTKK